MTLHEVRLGGVSPEQLDGSTDREPSSARPSRTGTLPVHASGPVALTGEDRRDGELRRVGARCQVLDRDDLGDARPVGPRAQCTTTSMLSLTSVLSAVSGSSLADSDSWQMNRRRVSAWRAEPAWIVVKPFTPDDSVSSSGSASRSRTSPTMATSGAMRRKPATSLRRSTGRAVGAGGTGLHAGDVRQRDVGLEHLLGDHDAQRLGRARPHSTTAASSCRSPGAPATTIVCRACTHSARKAAAAGRQHVPLDELVEVAERHAGELADVHHDVTAAADVAVHDVQPGAVVELRVLQALGRIELAVRARRVVEDLREDPDDVLVVVEDLVVVAGSPTMPLHEDRRPVR